MHVNNSAFTYQENGAPVLLDTLTANYSVDGHDYRSNFDWILERGYDWVITDTADDWHARLKKQGKRNIRYMIADGEKEVEGKLASTWYRRHTRDFGF